MGGMGGVQVLSGCGFEVVLRRSSVSPSFLFAALQVQGLIYLTRLHSHTRDSPSLYKNQSRHGPYRNRAARSLYVSEESCISICICIISEAYLIALSYLRYVLTPKRRIHIQSQDPCCS